jgi:hypothetical protein
LSLRLRGGIASAGESVQNKNQHNFGEENSVSAILQNISVKTKLYAGFGIVCAAIVIQGIFIIYFNKLTIREISATQTEILPHALNYIELRRDI